MHQPYSALHLVQRRCKTLQQSSPIYINIISITNKYMFPLQKLTDKREQPLSQWFPSSDWALQEQCPSSASKFQLPASPTMHSSSFHYLCTKFCTDKDSQQHQSNSHTQTEIWHIGKVPQFEQDQSVPANRWFKQSVRTQTPQDSNFKTGTNLLRTSKIMQQTTKKTKCLNKIRKQTMQSRYQDTISIKAYKREIIKKKCNPVTLKHFLNLTSIKNLLGN